MEVHSGRGPNTIEIRMAAVPVWIPVARSVAERLAEHARFDRDAICDVRLAVDEACTAVVAQLADGSTMTCRFDVQPGRMDIEVSGAAADEPAPFAALGWRILRSVTDELVLRHQPGHVLSIRIAKQM
jgi:serine/threonine-protein kinase RsbW